MSSVIFLFCKSTKLSLWAAADEEAEKSHHLELLSCTWGWRWRWEGEGWDE